MKTICKFVAVVAACLVWTSAAFAAKERTYVDSKYVIIGVAGDNKVPDFQSNPVVRPINVNLGNYSQFGNKQDLENYFNKTNAGNKIIKAVLSDGNGKRSEEYMRSYAKKNMTLQNEEDVAVLGEDKVLEGLIFDLLSNNYIYVQQPGSKEGKYNIYIFRVKYDGDIQGMVWNAWEDDKMFDQIPIPVEYVGEKKNVKIEEISEEIPYPTLTAAGDVAQAFNVRANIFSNNPYLARTGSRFGVKPLDRFFIYQTCYDEKKDEVYSKRIAVTRASEVKADTTQLNTIYGRKVSFKKGTIAVLKKDNRSGISVSFAVAGFGKATNVDWCNEDFTDFLTRNSTRYGVRLGYDYLIWMNKLGMSLYGLGNLSVDFNGKVSGGTNPHEEYDGIYYTRVKDAFPFQANVGIGAGFGFRFLGNMELMPYVTVNGEYAGMVTPKEDNVSPEFYDYTTGKRVKNGMAVFATGGVRFNVNIVYPFEFHAGAEFNQYVWRDNGYRIFNPRGDKNNLIRFYAGVTYRF